MHADVVMGKLDDDIAALADEKDIYLRQVTGHRAAMVGQVEMPSGTGGERQDRSVGTYTKKSR